MAAALLLACFLQAGLVFGTLRSFGIFFPEFVDHFGSAAGSVSWVSSCAVAVQQLLSPLGCALALRFGSRPVVILGGLLSSLGMFLASFSSGLFQLYLSIGGVSGLGWALIFSPSMAAVTCCFRRRRSLATGFVLSGVGVFSFALSPLLQYLVEEYSWRGAMLLLSAVALHSVPCGALLSGSGEAGPARSFFWGWELLCNWAFLRYCLAVTLINAAYFVPFAHLVAHMRAAGAADRQAAFLMALVGVADVGGRLFAGWLSDLSPGCTLPLLSLWTGLAAVVLALFPLAASVVEMAAAAIGFGFCAGALTPGVFSGLPWVVGAEKVLPALGLLQMLESVGGLLGPPISGWLYDLTGDFSMSFLVSGSFLLLGALIILTLPGICCKSGMGLLESKAQRTSVAGNGVPSADYGGPMANGCCEGRAEQWDSLAVLDYRIGPRHWPPLERRAGHDELQGDPSSRELFIGEDERRQENERLQRAEDERLRRAQDERRQENEHLQKAEDERLRRAEDERRQENEHLQRAEEEHLQKAQDEQRQKDKSLQRAQDEQRQKDKSLQRAQDEQRQEDKCLQRAQDEQRQENKCLQRAQDEQRQEAEMDRMPLSAGRLLEYHRLSPVTSLPLSTTTAYGGVNKRSIY